MKVTVDTSELNQLTSNLADVPVKSWGYIYEAVRRGSLDIKDQWAENLGGKSNPASAFKHIGGSVDFDIGPVGGMLAYAAGVASGVESLIGPNLGKRQGAMAGWFEEGMRNIPALHAGNEALRRNEKNVEDRLALAVADAIEQAL